MIRNTLLRVLLALLVVTSLGVPVVAAQEGNETEGDDSEGGDGMMPEMPEMPEMPSGSDLLKDAIEWVLEDAKEGLENGIDKLHFVLVGMPAPGDHDDPSTWVPPENGAWPYVFTMFGLTSSISIIMLVFATQFALGMNDLKRKREAIRQIARAFVYGPVLGFPILALALHTGNAFAMALSPSGEEFLANFGTVADLGFGFILGALLIKFKILIIFLGLAILVIVYFTILFLAASWPALWAMRVVPIPTLQSWGMLGLTGFGKLIILRVIQAFLLRFTFEMPWGSIGTGSFFLVVLGTAVGLLLALVVLPWIVLRKVTIASAVGLGMSGISVDAVNNAPDRIRSGASSLRSRVRNTRSTSPPKETGKVRSHAYTQKDSTRSVGSFGSNSSSQTGGKSRQRGRSNRLQSKRNADRAAKNRSAD